MIAGVVLRTALGFHAHAQEPRKLDQSCGWAMEAVPPLGDGNQGTFEPGLAKKEAGRGERCLVRPAGKQTVRVLGGGKGQTAVFEVY